MIFQQPNFFGCLEPAPDLAAAANDAGALRGRARRPDLARRARGARATTAARSRSARARARATTSPTAARTTASSPSQGRVHPPDARPDRRRDDRPERRARLRADAADPRAAHPPREGDLEHHDEPDAARARRARPPLLARPAGAARGGGDLHGPRRATRRSGSGCRSRFRSRPTFKEFARARRTARARGDRATRASAASTRATRSAATTRAWTTCCSSPSPRSARPADIDRLARGARGGARLMKLIYEKSQAGPARRRRCRSYDLPAAEVPEELRRARAAAPARARRAGARPPLHGALDAQLRHRHRLLPARLLHDEAQPARQRARRRCCPASRTSTRYQEEDGAQGALELMWRLQEILAEVAGLDAVLAPAGRRLAGRADRADADARLLRRPRRGRAARHDRHRRHRARHEPGERDDGRLQAREGRHRRARQPRPRRPAREGERAHGRADADEPVDARPLRREHRGGRDDLPRRRRAPLLRRREPERRLRDLAAGRHGLRHRPHQPAQDVLAAARRRRPGRRADRRARASSSRSCRCRRSCADGDAFRLDHDRPKSIGKVRGFTGPFGVFVRSYAYIRVVRAARCARCPRSPC